MRIKIALLVTLLAIIVIITRSGCALPVHLPKVNYIGKTHAEVALLLQKISGGHAHDILIESQGRASALNWKSYRSVDDILKDKDAMTASGWGVNWKSILWSSCYYRLSFRNDRVISQEKQCHMDTL